MNPFKFSSVSCSHNTFFLCVGTFQTFEREANLLRRIAGHKCMIAAPAVQVLNFADEPLQRFFSALPRQRQPALRELFSSPTCTETYMYSLYGVTMATKLKVCTARWDCGFYKAIWHVD